MAHLLLEETLREKMDPFSQATKAVDTSPHRHVFNGQQHLSYRNEKPSPHKSLAADVTTFTVHYHASDAGRNASVNRDTRHNGVRGSTAQTHSPTEPATPPLATRTRHQNHEVHRATPTTSVVVDTWTTLNKSVALGVHAFTIKHLSIECVELGSSPWRWLLTVLPQLSLLEHLSLKDTGLTDDRFSELSGLVCYTISRGAPTPAAIRHSDLAVAMGPSSASSSSLTPSLTSFTRLASLDLSDNYLTHKSALALGKFCIWNLMNLQALAIGNNELGDSGAQVLAVYLSKMAPLRPSEASITSRTKSAIDVRTGTAFASRPKADALRHEAQLRSELETRLNNIIKLVRPDAVDDAVEGLMSLCPQLRARSAANGSATVFSSARSLHQNANGLGVSPSRVIPGGHRERHHRFGLVSLDLSENKMTDRGLAEILTGASKSQIRLLVLGAQSTAEPARNSYTDSFNRSSTFGLGSPTKKSQIPIVTLAALQPSVHCRWRALDLSGCGLGTTIDLPTTRRLLLSLLFACQRLEVLDVGDNPGLGDVLARLLYDMGWESAESSRAAPKSLSTIRTLRIANTGLTDVGAATLMHALLDFEPPVDILGGLEAIDFNLNEPSLSPEAFENLLAFFSGQDTPVSISSLDKVCGLNANAVLSRAESSYFSANVEHARTPQTIAKSPRQRFNGGEETQGLAKGAAFSSRSPSPPSPHRRAQSSDSRNAGSTSRDQRDKTPPTPTNSTIILRRESFKLEKSPERHRDPRPAPAYTNTSTPASTSSIADISAVERRPSRGNREAYGSGQDVDHTLLSVGSPMRLDIIEAADGEHLSLANDHKGETLSSYSPRRQPPVVGSPRARSQRINGDGELTPQAVWRQPSHSPPRGSDEGRAAGHMENRRRLSPSLDTIAASGVSSTTPPPKWADTGRDASGAYEEHNIIGQTDGPEMDIREVDEGRDQEATGAEEGRKKKKKIVVKKVKRSAKKSSSRSERGESETASVASEASEAYASVTSERSISPSVRRPSNAAINNGTNPARPYHVAAVGSEVRERGGDDYFGSENGGEYHISNGYSEKGGTDLHPGHGRFQITKTTTHTTVTHHKGEGHGDDMSEGRRGKRRSISPSTHGSSASHNELRNLVRGEEDKDDAVLSDLSADEASYKSKARDKSMDDKRADDGHEQREGASSRRSSISSQSTLRGPSVATATASASPIRGDHRLAHFEQARGQEEEEQSERFNREKELSRRRFESREVEERDGVLELEDALRSGIRLEESSAHEALEQKQKQKQKEEAEIKERQRRKELEEMVKKRQELLVKKASELDASEDEKRREIIDSEAAVFVTVKFDEEAERKERTVRQEEEEEKKRAKTNAIITEASPIGSQSAVNEDHKSLLHMPLFSPPKKDPTQIAGRLKSFTLTYAHPPGHLLCLVWHGLHMDSHVDRLWEARVGPDDAYRSSSSSSVARNEREETLARLARELPVAAAKQPEVYGELCSAFAGVHDHMVRGDVVTSGPRAISILKQFFAKALTERAESLKRAMLADVCAFLQPDSTGEGGDDTKCVSEVTLDETDELMGMCTFTIKTNERRVPIASRLQESANEGYVEPSNMGEGVPDAHRFDKPVVNGTDGVHDKWRHLKHYLRHCLVSPKTSSAIGKKTDETKKVGATEETDPYYVPSFTQDEVEFFVRLESDLRAANTNRSLQLSCVSPCHLLHDHHGREEQLLDELPDEMVRACRELKASEQPATTAVSADHNATKPNAGTAGSPSPAASAPSTRRSAREMRASRASATAGGVTEGEEGASTERGGLAARRRLLQKNDEASNVDGALSADELDRQSSAVSEGNEDGTRHPTEAERAPRKGKRQEDSPLNISTADSSNSSKEFRIDDDENTDNDDEVGKNKKKKEGGKGEEREGQVGSPSWLTKAADVDVASLVRSDGGGEGSLSALVKFSAVGSPAADQQQGDDIARGDREEGRDPDHLAATARPSAKSHKGKGARRQKGKGADGENTHMKDTEPQYLDEDEARSAAIPADQIPPIEVVVSEREKEQQRQASTSSAMQTRQTTTAGDGNNQPASETPAHALSPFVPPPPPQIDRAALFLQTLTEQRVKLLLALCFNSVNNEHIDLEESRRNKARAGKGTLMHGTKKEKVSVSVEWDQLLVVKRYRGFSEKQIIFMHPLVCSTKATVSGPKSKDLVITCEQPCGPEELGDKIKSAYQGTPQRKARLIQPDTTPGHDRLLRATSPPPAASQTPNNNGTTPPPEGSDVTPARGTVANNVSSAPSPSPSILSAQQFMNRRVVTMCIAMSSHKEVLKAIEVIADHEVISHAHFEKMIQKRMDEFNKKEKEQKEREEKERDRAIALAATAGDVRGGGQTPRRGSIAHSSRGVSEERAGDLGDITAQQQVAAAKRSGFYGAPAPPPR